MLRRPSHAAIDRWLVVGAVGASLGHVFLRLERPAVAARLGLGDPILSLFVLWALAVAFQAACWWAWSVIRDTSKSRQV
jgi:hypothetical protein